MLSALVMVALSYFGLRWYALRVERSRGEPVDKVHRLRRANVVFALLLVVPIGVAVLELRYETNLVGEAVWLVSAILLPVLVIASLVGAYLGIRPVYEKLRGIEGTTSGAPKRMTRLLVGLLLPQFVLMVGVFVLLVADAPTAVLVVAFVMFLVIFATAGPLVLMAAIPTRQPDPATKEQLERLCAVHDVRIRGVRVIDTRHDPAVNAAFTGFGPGPKYIFVTDRLLETLVADELEAVIAHEIGHRKKHHILIKVGAHLGTVALLFGALALLAFFGNGGSLVGIAAFALPVLFIGSLLLVQGTVAIRLEHQADEYAVSHAGAQPLRRALERIAEVNMLRRRTGWFWNLMQQHPGLQSRLERIENDSHRPGPYP
jgi:Zn-dependent protease with chaperone function